MAQNRFEIPVTVKADAAGRLLALRTVEEASDFLLNRWQSKRTEKHRTALQACSDVINGGKPEIVARRAVVAAMREAGLFLDEKSIASVSEK